MKLPALFNDSDVRPFRFALILGIMFLVMLLATASDGQESPTTFDWTTSYPEAVDQANEQNAPIMLFFSGSDWCPWCRKLNAEVFDTPAFSAWSNQRVVPMMVDFPKTRTLPGPLANQNNRLLDRYRQHLAGFPTALFIRPDGTVVGKLGYEPDGLLTWIDKAQRIVGKLDKLAYSGSPVYR